MQPAYYENLEEIQNKYWSMLDDAVTNRGSPFRIPVFICTHQSEVDGRIVVLRKSDRENNLLQFHTDFRSPKVDILKKNKNASLVFYDKEEKIQLRVKVECQLVATLPPLDVEVLGKRGPARARASRPSTTAGSARRRRGATCSGPRPRPPPAAR